VTAALPAVAGSPAATQPVAWFCLRTRSRHEFSVRDALAAQGIEHFLPTATTESRWTDRIAKVERPLFNGYIFARCVPTEALAVLRTRGAVQLLGVDGPEIIPDEVIANLRRFVESPVPLSLGAYAAGETVRVMRGPFAGVAGVIRRVKGATTLSIPIEILCRVVSVEIDAADVEPND
jgi:transcription antitermination factor NusG